MLPSARFWRAVIEGLIPPHPSETTDQRERALQHAAVFVRDQLRAMPLVLQVLLAAGISVFTIVTWLRWLRGVHALDAKRRERWMHAWAYGGNTFARKLFRAPRSLAALAYFECIG